MTTSIAVCITVLALAIMCNTHQIYRLGKKLDGKADRKKSRPGAKRVPALQRFREDEAGNDIVRYICSHCNCDPVPKIGHTVKQCQAAQEAK